MQALPPINCPFNLWYDSPNSLKPLHREFLKVYQPDIPPADEIAVKFSSAGPQLQMQFEGMIASLPAVILADSGANHLIIDKPFVIQHKLRVCPCAYASAKLANGSSVNLSGQVTFKLKLANVPVMVTALVMASIVPGVHLILGDEWLTTHKAKLDYENLTMRFKIRGRVVAMPTISSATKGPTLSGISEPATAYSTAQLSSETTTHYPILSAISAKRALQSEHCAKVPLLSELMYAKVHLQTLPLSIPALL